MTLTVTSDAAPLEGSDLQRFVAIYEEAFPAEERSDFDEGEWRAAGRRFTVARDHDGLVGFAVSVGLSSGVVLIEYLAVDHRRRGAGIGSAVLGALRAASDDELVLEVDDPLEIGIDDDEQDVRERRIAFYRRNGLRPCRPVLSYEPPSFTEAPAPRLLLLSTLGGDDAALDTAGRVAVVLAESYGLDPDEVSRRVAAALDRTGELR